jgi:hypothetical protein
MRKQLTIWFWKVVSIVWDLRPRMHIPKYSNYPIASCEIREKYDYPEGDKVLYEWDEKGLHWIAFSR